MSTKILSLDAYGISEEYGFLLKDPMVILPDYFMEWNDLGLNLRGHISSKALRSRVDRMPLLDHNKLASHRERCLAFVLLSYIGNGYVWQDGDDQVPKKIPRQLAVPWTSLARDFGMMPILCNFTFALCNYKLKNQAGGITVDNIEAICTLPDSEKTNWITEVTVLVEKAAAPGLMAIVDGVNAVKEKSNANLLNALDRMFKSLESMLEATKTIHINLTGERFYKYIRPYFMGWGGERNPAPNGIVYEGVSDEPIKCVGTSAGQSSTIQCFDAALGVQLNPDKAAYLKNLRNYMPSDHRHFVEAIQRDSHIKEYVLREEKENPALLEAYGKCVEAIRNFRSYHIQVVSKYIIIPSKLSKENENFKHASTKGTGGTDIIPFLKDIRNSTVTPKQ